jgi:cell division protein FtsX
MANVVFAFREHASEEKQDLVRNQILGLPGVQNVARISPDATKATLRRLWYADVADDGAASNLLKHLREHDDIQSADLPAERRLID